MCVMSMVMDDFRGRYTTPIAPQYWIPPPRMPTPQEIEDFWRLYERAKEYDKRNNEPDCEMEEKKEALYW